MATFTLSIEIDVEKFRDDPTAVVQRMMATAAYHLRNGEDGAELVNRNGEIVGSYRLDTLSGIG